MKNVLVISAIAASMVVLGASCNCGGGGGTVSCTKGAGTNLEDCIEYNWSGGLYSDVWTAECTQAGRSAGSGCSHSGAIGGCKVTVSSAGSSLNTTQWYYDASVDSSLTSLQTECTAQGQGGSGTTSSWVSP